MEYNGKLSGKKEYVLLALLAVLNIILRFPYFPHENGSDTFFIHGLANSISMYGHANWILHPLSVFGLYPFSYPSGMPFAMSGWSQCMGVEMEHTILLISTFIGIFGAFTVYIMAKEIKNDNLFAFFAAFSFSVSVMFVTWTFWRMSTRASFVLLLPIFVWCLLRYHKETEHKLKYGLTMLFLFIILATLHHIFLFIILFILIPYFITIFYQKMQQRYNFSEKLTSYILLGLMIILFFLPILGVIDIQNVFTRGKFAGTGPFITFLNLGFDYVSYTGLLLFFAPIGLLSLTRKTNKDFSELFLIFVFVSSAVFLFDREYVLLFCLPLIALLVGFGMMDTLNFSRIKQKKKTICTVLIAIILLSTMFSMYITYLPNRYSPEKYSGWMNEKTYNTALFIEEIPSNKMILSNYVYTSIRTSSISGVPTIRSYMDIISSNSTIRENLEIEKPAIKDLFKGGKSLWTGWKVNDWYMKGRFYNKKHEENIMLRTDKVSQQLISNYGITAVIDYKYMHGKYLSSIMLESSPFMAKVYETAPKVYDNGMEAVYKLNTKYN